MSAVTDAGGAGRQRSFSMTYREAMRYEVHVPNPDGSVERFFVDREKLLRKGDVIEQMTLAYTVRSVLPGTCEVDAVIETHPLGPAQAGHQDG